MIVFLHSDLEYEWPVDDPRKARGRGPLSWGCTWLYGSGLALGAAIVLIDALIHGWHLSPARLVPELIAPLFCVGVAFYFLAGVLFIARFTVLRRWRRWRGTDDPVYDLWPFKRREDLDAVLAQPPRLLGGRPAM